MGGGMETNKNRWIEDWSTARENLEHNFRWTRRNLAIVGLFGIAVPVLIYKGIVREFGYEWSNGPSIHAHAQRINWEKRKKKGQRMKRISDDWDIFKKQAFTSQKCWQLSLSCVDSIKNE